MRIRMLRSLGSGWSEAGSMTEGSEHNVSTAQGEALAAKGLAEILERDPPAAKVEAEPVVDEPKPRETQPLKRGKNNG